MVTWYPPGVCCCCGEIIGVVLALGYGVGMFGEGAAAPYPIKPVKDNSRMISLSIKVIETQRPLKSTNTEYLLLQLQQIDEPL